MCKICGVGISAEEAAIVILEGNRSSFEVIKTDFKKIELVDDTNQSTLKSFYETIHDMFKQNSIDKVVVKRPNTAGKYQSKYTTFKIEALIQMCDVDVELVKSQTLAAFKKKDSGYVQKLGDVHKYQYPALEAAYYGLEW